MCSETVEDREMSWQRKSSLMAEKAEHESMKWTLSSISAEHMTHDGEFDFFIVNSRFPVLYTPSRSKMTNVALDVLIEYHMAATHTGWGDSRVRRVASNRSSVESGSEKSRQLSCRRSIQYFVTSFLQCRRHLSDRQGCCTSSRGPSSP